jgi:hypothetical protein
MKNFQHCLTYLSLLFTASVAASDVSIKNPNPNEFVFDLAESKITVGIRDVVLLSKQEMLLDWVVQSAQIVENYYGRFPVPTVDIKLEVSDGKVVKFGQAFGGEFPSVRIVIGEDINPAMLQKDWIMVHEMVHLAMAHIPRKHRWWLEGLSTYVESIARVQLGFLSESFVWNGFINRMPQGLPQAGDQGLDNTPTWGRTYWGGAVFCLLADIEIRKKTSNRLSLKNALRGVLNDGYSMQADTDPMTIFKSADRETGIDVLVPLYQTMRADPYPIDLDALWQELGVSLENNEVVYNDEAPLAHIRAQLLK